MASNRTFSVLFLFVLLAALMSGCSVLSQPNNVEVITPASGPVTRASDGKYENLYPGKKSYPVTCQQDCYPRVSDITCDDSTGLCQFTGSNAAPALSTGFTVSWLGHASFLVSLPDGTRMLIEPVSGQFDWPIDWLHALAGGITRQEPVWPDSVTDVDAVLYSHLHYDHFNKADIDRLGNAPQYFVHQSTADYLPQRGLDVKEVSWFSGYQLGPVSISAVPAHHFNSRYWVPYIYNDDEQALWGGWLLEYKGHTLFFAGDTGYSKHFGDIKQQYGTIDICLLPIASYYHAEYGAWYRYVHTTPEDALVAAQELECKVMIPWGYGNASWQMGDHSSHSALRRLLKMHPRVNASQSLLILNEGDTVSL